MSDHLDRPNLRTRPIPDNGFGPRRTFKPPEGDAAFHRPHMDETRMVELIVAFWRAKGFSKIEAYVENGTIRSNIGRNVYPPKD